jgi:hypothetical protein
LGLPVRRPLGLNAHLRRAGRKRLRHEKLDAE